MEAVLYYSMEHLTREFRMDMRGECLVPIHIRTFSACHFEHNRCIHGGRGGAIRTNGTASLSLQNCHLQENMAAHGGALALESGGAIMVHDSTLRGNIASGSHSLIQIRTPSLDVGREIFSSSVSLAAVDERESNYRDYAILSGGGGAVACRNGLVRLVSSHFCDNQASKSDGGAIWAAAECQLNLVDSIVEENHCNLFMGRGGGALIGRIQALIRNTSFINNEAAFGGGVHFGLQPQYQTRGLEPILHRVDEVESQFTLSQVGHLVPTSLNSLLTKNCSSLGGLR